MPRYWLQRVGNIEAVRPNGDGLRLTGWATADVLHVSWHGGSLDVRPDRPRHDVQRRRRGGPCNLGFEVDLPARSGPVRITIETPSGTLRWVEVQHPSAPRGPRVNRRLRRAFLRDMVRAGPDLAKYALQRGEANKAEIKDALGLSLGPHAPLLDGSWFGTDAPALPSLKQPVSIIMPIHNGFGVLCEALDRVSRHTNGDWRMILVDDASTDPRVGPFLQDWLAAQGARAELLSLETNIGFVGAVNHALARIGVRDGPVVLLNSDAFVPELWLERLIEPLTDPEVASVTPFSNAAEIFSAPVAAMSQTMSSALADQIDLVARRLARPTTLPSAPTGVGFCMALLHDWLKRVPRFDPAFGRGYGEEVDWCQRVRALGGRHVGTPGLFVRHVGGGSFGAEKAARVAAANAMISKRYPRYDADVQGFLMNDPLRTARLALAIAWAGFSVKGPLPVYLAHSLGGGADMALERDIARDLRTVGAAVILRVGGASRFIVELRLPHGRVDGATASFKLIEALLAPVPSLRIVYSCGVGDPVAVESPDLLLRLRRDTLTDRLEARLHDFYPVSSSYCLLGSVGWYRGPVKGEARDPAHRYRGHGGRTVSLIGKPHGAGFWRPAMRSLPIP